MKDLSNYKYFPQILVSVLIIDLIVIFLVRYFPNSAGSTINIWYDTFGLSAVIADVLIIVLGIMIAQYIYKNYIQSDKEFNPYIFGALLVAVQIIHDLLFYFGVIQPIPEGHNEMIDVFKTYSDKGGFKVVAADSAMMLGSVAIASFLAAAPKEATLFSGVLAAYSIPFILTTKWR